MGSNLTKSQSLHQLFSEYQLLPELTSNISNNYEFIFVGKGSQIFIIKEVKSMLKIDHPNVLRMIEMRKLDDVQYGLFEWVPHSVQKFYQANPSLLNRESAISLIAACVKVYTYLWKTDQNQFIDIRSENIKSSMDSEKIVIKVLPPTLTLLPKGTYKNRISDLGFVVRSILIGKNQYQHYYIEKKYGKDVEEFVNMMLATQVTNLQQWEKLQMSLTQLQHPKRYEHIYQNPEKSQFQEFNMMQVSQIPKNYIHERKSAYPTGQPIQHFNVNKYTSQYPQPVSHHQHFQQKGPFNRTQVKNINQNGDQSFRSQRSITPRKSSPQIVGSRILSTMNRSPSKFATEDPHMKINNPKVIVFQKSIQALGMFAPSAKDPVSGNWKSGIPSISYTPKMKEDKNFIYEDEVEKEVEKQKEKEIDNKEENRKKGLIENLLINKKKKEEESLLKEEKTAEKHRSSRKELSLSQIKSQKSQKSEEKEKEQSIKLDISDDEELIYDGVYEGNYHPMHKQVKHGQGRLTFPSGGSYVGNFSWNKMDGWGKLFYPSGRLAFEGYWKAGKFDGYGKLFNETPLHVETFDYSNFNKIQEKDDGYWKVYEGGMKNDMKQGEGIWVLENGEKYQGEFHKDKVSGEGTFYGKKETVEGKWQDNILIEVYKCY